MLDLNTILLDTHRSCMQHQLNPALLLVLTALLAACAGNSQMNQETAPQPPRTIVVGMTEDPIQLNAFENNYANTLRTNSESVCLVATGLPELYDGLSVESLREAADEARADVIILNRMVPSDRRDSDVGALSAYLARSSGNQPLQQGEGRIASHAFDAETGALLWSGWSDPVNPKGRLRELADAAEKLADDVAGEDIMKPREK